MRPSRLVALALTAAALAALSGCGGSDDKAQITTLVKEMYAAIASHNGAAACELLTPQARVRVQATAGILRGQDCGETLSVVSRLPTGAQARKIATYHAGKIVVDGNVGGVLIEPSAPGTKPTRVEKIDGKWLIDGSVAVTH